jgi:hypothetical protein
VPPLPVLPVVPVPVLPVVPVLPLPVFPVVPVLPELPLVPLLPVVVVPPPPTGAAPPEADDTGMVVVVVDGGVVVAVLGGVVVVVVDVAVPVAPATGVVGSVPTTVRTAVGVAFVAGRGDDELATMALPWAEEVLPANTGAVPPDWLTVPMGAVLVGPAGRLALGTVVVVLLGCEETGPLAESTLWAIGPAPILRPATTDSAAATTAPDATRRLRTKKSFDAVIGSGTTARRGALGRGCPKERDVKTSSKVALSFASAHSGFVPPMFLQNNRLFGRALASRSPAPEVQTPPHVQPYNGASNVNTGNPECGLELVRTAVCTLKSQVLLHASCTKLRAVSRGCHGVVGRHRVHTPMMLNVQRVAHVLHIRRQQSTCNRMAMHRCYKVVALTAWSTESSTPLTALVTALVAGAAAGSVLPIWFARPVTEVPTVVTVLPTPATGVTGLPPPEPGDAPEDPPPDDPPAGAGSVPVVVAAPMRVTRPPGWLPAPPALAEVASRARAPDPIEPVREPGAVGAVEASPGSAMRPCGPAAPCAPWADLFEGPCWPVPAVTPATTRAMSALNAAIVQYRPLWRFHGGSADTAASSAPSAASPPEDAASERGWSMSAASRSVADATL